MHCGYKCWTIKLNTYTGADIPFSYLLSLLSLAHARLKDDPSGACQDHISGKTQGWAINLNTYTEADIFFSYLLCLLVAD